jgi:hypothetical protein
MRIIKDDVESAVASDEIIKKLFHYKNSVEHLKPIMKIYSLIRKAFSQQRVTVQQEELFPSIITNKVDKSRAACSIPSIDS